MNSEKVKTFDPHKPLVHLTDKIDLRRKDKYIPLSNLSIYDTWENLAKSYDNNKLKISVPIWNEEFKLPDEPHSVPDI